MRYSMERPIDKADIIGQQKAIDLQANVDMLRLRREQVTCSIDCNRTTT